jgi:hypothetical protein
MKSVGLVFTSSENANDACFRGGAKFEFKSADRHVGIFVLKPAKATPSPASS